MQEKAFTTPSMDGLVVCLRKNLRLKLLDGCEQRADIPLLLMSFRLLTNQDGRAGLNDKEIINGKTIICAKL